MAALLDTVELKKVLRALLVSMPSPTGMSLQGLLKEYQDFEGTCLPYAQFGYSTPLDFLRVMSDTVQVGEYIYLSSKYRSYIDNIVIHPISAAFFQR